MNRLRLALLLPLLAACASSPEPVQTMPPTPQRELERRVPSPPIPQPSEAALRAADNVTLTGRELGTMWTFENPPLDYWAERYQFRPDAQWLEHVRLSSVRYGEICSASFVSPDGLVMTNHHCARECVEAQSTGGTDYVVEGFLAATRAEERVCPDLHLDQLIEIRDVTQRMQSAAPAGASPDQVTAAYEAETEEIEGECEAERFCQVVSLYNGGQYQLYVYRRYAPVKLVFAPELQAGFYGGDPDNFTYPRYALDVSFVRAYGPNDQPASTPHYFQWDPDGAEEDELVFVTGNPGSTTRLITVAHLLYEQQYRHPLLVGLLAGQRDVLQEVASRGPQAEQAVRQDLFSIENSLKAYSGQLEGLRDTLLVARKIAWEREFRSRIDADPALKSQYGDVWNRLAALQGQKLIVSPRLNMSNGAFLQSPHLVTATQLVEYVRAMADGQAAQEVQALGATLRAPSRADPQIAGALLRLHLSMADRWLTSNDPLRAALFNTGETPEQAAARIESTTRIMDAAFRTSLIDGGVSALEASTDPLVRFAVTAAPIQEEMAAQWEQIQDEEAVQRERLAKALFAAYGTDVPPDATFTLRISDGVVAGYPYNGTMAPPHTTFFGMFGRAAAFANAMPWTLPETFAERRADIDMSKPLNFVSTNDITGGNSGSPVIDRDARVVGIAFDGNIEQLPNEFVFRDTAGRTVSVHSAGILEALRSVYRADALVAELTGGSR